MELELCEKRYALRVGCYDGGRMKLVLENDSDRLEISGQSDRPLPAQSALILKNEFNLAAVSELQRLGVIIELLPERVDLGRWLLPAKLSFDRLYDFDPDGLICYLVHLGEREQADYYRNIPRHIVTVHHDGYECLSLTQQKPATTIEMAKALGVTTERLSQLIDESIGQMKTPVWHLGYESGILIGFSLRRVAQAVADYIMLRLGILKSYQLLCEWTMTGYSEQTAYRLSDAIDAAEEKGPPAHGEFGVGTFHVASHYVQFKEAVSFRCSQCGSVREAPGYYHELYCPDCGGMAVRMDEEGLCY